MISFVFFYEIMAISMTIIDLAYQYKHLQENLVCVCVCVFFLNTNPDFSSRPATGPVWLPWWIFPKTESESKTMKSRKRSLSTSIYLSILSFYLLIYPSVYPWEVLGMSLGSQGGPWRSLELLSHRTTSILIFHCLAPGQGVLR